MSDAETERLKALLNDACEEIAKWKTRAQTAEKMLAEMRRELEAAKKRPTFSGAS